MFTRSPSTIVVWFDLTPISYFIGPIAPKVNSGRIWASTHKSYSPYGLAQRLQGAQRFFFQQSAHTCNKRLVTAQLQRRHYPLLKGFLIICKKLLQNARPSTLAFNGSIFGPNNIITNKGGTKITYPCGPYSPQTLILPPINSEYVSSSQPQAFAQFIVV